MRSGVDVGPGPTAPPADAGEGRWRWWAPGIVPVLVATLLRTWHLGQNGWDNEYYTAAVRSMAGSWHTFLYNSFDPAGFVSVDKPPVALWVQVASVKLLGFHPIAVLLPRVLAGVATVALVYHLVRRRFGALAGFLSALFLALTPVSVAVDRSSNTESCLLLVLVLAAWALTPVGLLRLADGQLAAQVAWLAPLALAGLLTGSLRTRLRRPLAPEHLTLALWGGWAFTYAVVYSFAGGIFHFYYLSTMAPPLAALAGIGVAGAWEWYLQGGRRAVLLPAALLATAAWQGHVEWSAIGSALDRLGVGRSTLLLPGAGQEPWWTWLHATLAGGSLMAVAILAPGS